MSIDSSFNCAIPIDLQNPTQISWKASFEFSKQIDHEKEESFIFINKDLTNPVDRIIIRKNNNDLSLEITTQEGTYKWVSYNFSQILKCLQNWNIAYRVDGSIIIEGREQVMQLLKSFVSHGNLKASEIPFLDEEEPKASEPKNLSSQIAVRNGITDRRESLYPCNETLYNPELVKARLDEHWESNKITEDSQKAWNVPMHVFPKFMQNWSQEQWDEYSNY